MSEQKKKWHSIPLRRSAPIMTSGDVQTQQAQTRESRNTTSASVQTRKAQAQVQLRYTTTQPALDDGEEEEEDYLPVQIPGSARRYVDTQGRDVYQQGNKRMVVEHASRIHWLLPAGLGAIAMILLVIGLMWFGNWWDAHQLDATYGYPRHFDINQVVGIDHDSASQPSHFIFENLNAHVVFIFIPAGDISKAAIYPVVTLQGDNAASYPVTASFADINHDGRIDLLIHVGDQIIVFLNTGNGFKPQV